MAKRIKANEAQPDLFGEVDRRRASQNRTTFRLSRPAKQAMLVRMTQDGYGLRDKSRWIMDVVREFLDPKTWAMPNDEVAQAWKRVVIDTELQREPVVPDAVNIPESMRVDLWRAAIDAALYGAELEEPVYLEISTASVIRAAIMWKLGQAPS